MTASSPTISTGGNREASFYAAQANREQGAADAATLSNVREKHQHAANAWTVLADRASNRDAARGLKAQAGELVDALGQQSENPDRIET